MSVVHRFYTAFVAGDVAAMGACYADDARFSDPAFGNLDAKEVRAMWAMLVGRSSDLRVKFGRVEEDEMSAVYEWHAHYTFTSTGRSVHNIIRSVFELRDGLIVRQRDEFDFWRWSRQALGPVGWLLGWSPLVMNKVRRNARAALARAMG
ncbi:MAG: nuclear transport factor 2 family protein [Flavobacteriales bacterium]|nr:nuclear transport factor 2 family protein [Flavobacteriales bacterium]